MASIDKKPQGSDTRWWVEQHKSRERARPEERSAPVGSSFFRSVEGYDQEKATANLTNLNLRLLAQADAKPGEWAYLPLVQEQSPAKEIEKVKRAIPLPPTARGVIVDSGLSLRVIITGEPVGERMLEFNLIEEASFDCWIHGEWVCEQVFKGKRELLHRAAELLRQYMTKDVMKEESFFDAPRAQGAFPPARTEW
jgi:hypothetical protein